MHARIDAAPRVEKFFGVMFPVLVMVALSAAAAEPVIRSQHISLEAGWNAVFLEVTPAANAPDTVFSGLPVDRVATYFPPLSGVQFISDPDELSWKKPAWGLWYAPGLPEAEFNTLDGIVGNRAYLIHATRSSEWTISGAVHFQPIVWQPNSFNFVGLPVDPENPPTFAAFFGLSKAHAQGRFYRLVAGKWRKITAPGSERVRAGEAYWIYCSGRSAYQGPLNIDFRGRDGLNFGAQTEAIKLTIRNLGVDAAALAVELDPRLPPLSRVLLDRETLAHTLEPLSGILSLGELPGGTALILTLQIQRAAMPQNAQAGLLTFRSDTGILLRLPVTALRTAE